MMTQFPNFRQPAMGIQDAAMLPAQTGNLLMRRALAAEAAFVPTTQTFDSTTSSTTLNSTVASSQGGSIRSLMIPTGEAGFVAIAQPVACACAQCGCQSGNCSSCQTGQGSSAGMAIFGGAGISLAHCGCGCTRTVGDEVTIDEENTNGIDDGDDVVQTPPMPPVYDPPVEGPGITSVVTVPAATSAAPAAPAANVQYVTYNA